MLGQEDVCRLDVAVEGITLSSTLKTGYMNFESVAKIVQQVRQALSAAHAKGICHLDLKPGNILFQDLGERETRCRLQSSPRASDIGGMQH